MEIMSIIMLAVLGESIWETSKMIWQNGKLSIDRLGAIIIGLLIALGTGIDLFALLNIPTKIPYLGVVLTGILISRGANFIHDLLSTVSNIQQNKLDK